MDSMVEALENSERVNMKREVVKREVAGMEGSFMVLSYDSENHLFWHEVLIFGKEKTLWWVEVTGSRRGTDSFGNEIASMVFGGIRATE